MANQKRNRLLALALALCLALGMLLPAGQVNAEGRSAGILTEVTGQEREQLASLADDTLALEEPTEASPAADTPVRVFIVLSGKSALEQGYAASAMAEATAYTGRLLNRQAAVIESIETQVLKEPLEVRYQFTAVANAISAVVPYGSMEEIATLPGVEQVCPVPVYETCQTELSPMTITTGDMVGSYGTWENGYTGAGMRIAVIDTGLDLDHPSFDPAAYDYALGQEQGSWDLLDQEEIAQVLPRLTIAQDGLTAADLYRNTKVAFGYNYVDGDLDITHDHDSAGDHGTHVSGIATANRYVPKDGGFASAAETVLACGVAPEAQLLVMKVFGKNGGAYADDYMAAIQDAISLGCDAINLSLGSNSPGFVDPAGSGVAYAERLFQSLTQTDTVVTISAGNAYSAGFQSATGTDLHRTSDPDVDTVGSPGSYENALTVASVTNSGLTGPYLSMGQINASYTAVGSAPSGLESWESLDADGEGTEYPFVFLGDPTSDTDTRKYAMSQSDFNGLDVTGKIVLVSRGTNAFSEKHSFAAQAGARAVIVYNNTSGTVNMDLSASTGTIPCVFLTQKDMQRILAASEQGADGSWGGVMTLHSAPAVLENAEDGYRMSDFSSWGVPGDLSLKPEITAPGGNIYSTLDGGAYGAMSGTSMAAPAMAGLSALVLQYIDDQNLTERTGLSARALAQALLMSTAKPLTEESGLPYSPRKQGAGLANAQKATTAQSYLLTGAASGNDGKVKVELGDDPDRTGSYQFTFTVYNLSQEPKTYAFGSDVLTEAVETLDGVDYMAETSHGLSPKVDFAVASMPYDLTGDNRVDREDAMAFLRHCNGSLTLPEQKLAILDLDGDGAVTTGDAQRYLCQLEDLEGAVMEDTGCTVAPGGSATVTVTMDLSKSDRAYLDGNFENGIYVDGFVYVREVERSTEEGVILENADLSLPFLAYYGSWSEPPMLEDAWYYDEATLEHSYSGGFNAAVTRVDGQAFGLGLNPFTAEASDYLADRNAISPNGDGMADCLAALQISLLRNAAEFSVRIESEDGKQVYYEEILENLNRAYYHANTGAWQNTIRSISLGWAGTDDHGAVLPDGTKAVVAITAKPGSGEEGQTWRVPITVDCAAPKADLDGVVLDSAARTLTVTVSDNQYLADAVLLDSAGLSILQRLQVDDRKPGTGCKLTWDLQDVRTTFCYLAVSDYAMNTAIYMVDLSDLNLGYEPNAFYGYMEGQGTSGWMSFAEDSPERPVLLTTTERAYRAAEYVDGCVYAVTSGNELVAMKFGEFLPAKVGAITLSESSLHWEFSTTTEILDMAYDYSTKTMYAIGLTRLNDFVVNVFLYTVDLDTGECTQVGKSWISGSTGKGVAALACDLEGNLYCVDRGTLSANLYKLELTDDDLYCKEIGNTGVFSYTSAQSMAFDHNRGCLYWSNYYPYPNSESQNPYQHNLIQVDLETGKGTVLGAIGGQKTYGLYIPYDRDPLEKSAERISLPETGWQFEGQTQQLQAAVFPVTAKDQRLLWSSSNETVASVDAHGMITAREAGTTTITVTSVVNPEISTSCEFTVMPFDDKTMRSYLADTGDGVPGWIQFNAAAPEEFTVLRETPGLHITGADSGKDVVYASGYTDDDRREALFCLDPDTLEVQKRINILAPTSDIAYSYYHDVVFFVYQSYFGFVPLKELTLGETTYPAGTALYYNLESIVKDDFITGIVEQKGMRGGFYIVTSSGMRYDVDITRNFGIMVSPYVLDLEVEAFSEQGNSLIYSYSAASGNPVYYYSVYNRVRQESTLYAITGDMDGKTQVLTLGSFGEGKAPLTGTFIDYLAEAGIHSAEVPEMLEGEPLLTLEPSELQVYQPPVSQDAQP